MNSACLAMRLLTLVLFGLMAGLFYAFSVTVMGGLNRIQAETAIDAMNGINEAVRNPVFFATFFGTPLVALLAALLSARHRNRRAGWLIGAAAVAYLIGVIAPTAAVNVPMNEALALIVSAEPAGQAELIWSDYSSRWTRWNTMRALVATGCLALAAYSLIPENRDQIRP
ncbi:MAG: DUF1772 domain-containing protein [Alphaproteobacteria bacterium]|nr:DUF1772 domain-containing protein [Alphaproteobacteria bacterium]